MLIITPLRVVTASAVALASLIATSASASEVTLSFVSHDLQLTGQLIAMDHDSYTLGTSWGEIKVPAAMVTCSGPACAPEQASASE